MDRRKLKSRSGLHRGLQSSSQTSTRDDELPSSGYSCASSVQKSQRISNTQKLRERIKEASGVSENTQKLQEKKKEASGVSENTQKLRERMKEAPGVSRNTQKLQERMREGSGASENTQNTQKKTETLKRKSQELKARRSKRFSESASDSNEETEEKSRSSKSKQRTEKNNDVEEKRSPLKLPRKESRISPKFPKSSSKEKRLISPSSKICEDEMSPNKRKRITGPFSDGESDQENITVRKKSKINERKSTSSLPAMSNKLKDFFNQSGLTLSPDDEPHELDDNPSVVVKRMGQLFFSAKFKVDEIITLWKDFIDEEGNLTKALKDVVIVNNDQPMNTNSTLVRMILEVEHLQHIAADHLLRKLNEVVLTADSMDDVPWASLLLQQFRFLEFVVDADSLTLRLEELVETCPIWFQRELILFLPDIVLDMQHNAVAEMLSKLMEAHVDLTNTVLECITNLTLGKGYLEELREKILNMLKKNVVVALIPVITRFVLYECPTVEVCEKVLSVVRSLDLQPLIGENAQEYFNIQEQLVSELRMSILMSDKMSKAAMNVMKQTTEQPKPLDLIILILVHLNKPMKKKSETMLKQHIKSGFYRSSLLSTMYQDYREVAKDMHSEALQLASTLLKSEDPAYADFTIDWFRLQFIGQAKAIHKQREILEKMILLMGNNDQTAKWTLGILKKIVDNEDEIKYLQPHCNHLRILLEKMENFDLEEVTILSDLMYALCASESSTSQALQDDLLILLQKQLSNAKTIMKCKGVLGASMAIKHLAGKSESCKTARSLFSNVQTGVKNCPRSRALFYDQIGTVIAGTSNIDPDFLKDIAEELQETFINEFMTDLNDYGGELIPKFGLNESDSTEKCAVDFGNGKSSVVVPAFFRLLRICYMRLNDGNLEDINALLGCPILMPQETDIPEPLSVDLTICCINWFRELINGFVTQKDDILEEQLVKRLENLMTLQAEFSTMMAMMSDLRHQPPPFYFHVYPVPPFVRVEKKIGKKGKRGKTEKSTNIPEWQSWQIGSALCSKNPTYFRRLDPKVVDLLDLNINLEGTQTTTNISKSQICFLINELDQMIESGQISETLMRDLVHLLPKICSKLNTIVQELREQDDEKNRHAAKLILSLLTHIFDWKAFGSPKYQSLLRDGLRTLAGQMDKANTMLRSSKELVEEAYKYFESLADVSTDICFAYAVVKMCRSLMRHSRTFTEQYKNKQANLASAFLALQWSDDNSAGVPYKTAVVGFLTNWIRNEPNPLETVTSVMTWLPDEIIKLEKPQDRLERLPSITKATFHHMFQKLFEGLIEGIKISLSKATTDPDRIKAWQQVGCNVEKIVKICKSSSRSVLLPFLRSMTSLLRIFLSSGMPILEQNLRFQTEEVTGIMKMMQGGTRYLNTVCVDCTEKKDITLAKVVPPAKQLTEKLLYLVKGMLVYNNSSEAFWMGNLVNKNLEGQQICSQSSEDEPTITTLGSSTAANSEDETQSDILQSDVEEQVSEEEQ